MRRILMLAGLLGSFTLSIGCGKGDTMIKTRGQVVRDGKDFKANDELSLEVYFVPIEPGGSPPKNWYAAEVNQSTGHFVAVGGHNKGMPPGKYRIAVEIKEKKKDTLEGKFNAENSPFEYQLDSHSEKLIIDLDNPTPKS